VIEWNEVSVRYPRATTAALAGVSFTARPRSMTAVVGPNGSGKSTLVRALLRRVPLERGRILVNNSDITAISQRELAQRVAVVVQREEPAFPMRAREYVALGRTPHASAWGDAGDERGTAAIEEAVVWRRRHAARSAHRRALGR
jgi:iron complex transport system ATP-binding protein